MCIVYLGGFVCLPYSFAMAGYNITVFLWLVFRI